MLAMLALRWPRFPRAKYKKDFTIQDELNLREAPKDTGNAYFMKGFTSYLAICTEFRHVL